MRTRTITAIAALLVLAIPTWAVAGTCQLFLGLGNCILPSQIPLVASSASGPDVARGAFSVTLRDVFDVPCPGAIIDIDFSGQTDMRLCRQPGRPDNLVICGLPTVRAVTDAGGVARFVVLGGSTANAPPPAIPVRIYADGVLVTPPSLGAVAWDLDGQNGLSINDLSVWLGDFGAPSYRSRGDYDGSHSLGINDLSLWLGAWGSQQQTQSCTNYCP